jgi:hypothetical protein
MKTLQVGNQRREQDLQQKHDAQHRPARVGEEKQDGGDADHRQARGKSVDAI